MEDVIDRNIHLTSVANIVASYVGNHSVPASELSSLIESVNDVLLGVSDVTGKHRAGNPAPAVPIEESVSANHIVCLECGKSFKSLKYHLSNEHQLTPEEYRRKWSLPASYPMVAKNYGKMRSKLAKKIGLGRSAKG